MEYSLPIALILLIFKGEAHGGHSGRYLAPCWSAQLDAHLGLALGKKISLVFVLLLNF